VKSKLLHRNNIAFLRLLWGLAFFFIGIPIVFTQEEIVNLQVSYVNGHINEEDSYSKKCFIDLWEDKNGRLWITPCGLELMINGISLFQYDGYDFNPYEIELSDGTFIQGTSVEVIHNNEILYGINQEGKIVSINLLTEKLNLLSKYDAESSEKKIWKLTKFNNQLYALTFPYNGKVDLYKIHNDQLELEEIIPIGDINFEGTRHDLRVYENQVWFIQSDLLVFKYDRQKKSINRISLDTFTNVEKTRVYTNHPILLRPQLERDAQGRIYFYNPRIFGHQILQWNEDQSAFEEYPSPSNEDWDAKGLFKDMENNLLFLYQDEQGEHHALILSSEEKWYDGSSAYSDIKNITNIKADNFLKSAFVTTISGIYSISYQEREIIEKALEGIWVSSMVHLNDSILLVNTVGQGWFAYHEQTGQIDRCSLSCDGSEIAFNNQMKQQIIPGANGKFSFLAQNHLINFDPSDSTCIDYVFEENLSLFAYVSDSMIVAKRGSNQLGFYAISKAFPKVNERIDTLPLGGFIKDVMVDSNRSLWVPTNNGLYKIDPYTREYTILGKKEGFSDFHFISIYEDRAGILWIGTYFGGLHRFDPASGEVSVLNHNNGLSNNSVMGIITDRDNDVWVATQYGINLVSSQGELITSLYAEDGLSSEVYDRFDPYRSGDGKLYFGSRNGVSIVDPIKLKKDIGQDSLIKIYLSEISYYDKDRKENIHINKDFITSGTITIPPDRPYIGLKFGLSSYLESDKNKYAYRLNGVDKDWTFIGNTPELKINRLPPGRYYLEIKGADFKNNWTRTPIRIGIHAPQFFYKTAWFYLLFSLPFIVFAYIWIRNKQLEAKRLEREVAIRTQKIRQDKQLIEQQAKELKNLDQLKSQFFTNISHELRTPITLIKTPLENLVEQYSDKLEKSIIVMLRLVLKNANKLGKLVEELLELSRLDAHKSKLYNTPTPIDSLCESLYQAYLPGAQARSIDLTYDSDLSAENILMVDRSRLEKVINNLLSNALKFTQESGNITMQIRLMDRILEIKVKDTGRGIPEEDLPFLFDRYFQTRRQELSTQGGTGIGLALSKELALLMGGDLVVYSEWQKGSEFVLTIPAIPGGWTTETELLPTSVNPGSSFYATEETTIPGKAHKSVGKILIVEDNPDMQFLISSVLEPVYECLITNDGLEAWNKLQEATIRPNDFQLIISDIMMPNMDGYEFLEKIKSDEKWMMHPVIMLTARSAEEDKLEALRMGVDDYLHKPFSSRELRLRIQNLIRNYNVRQEKKNENAHNKIVFQDLPAANMTWLKQVEDAAKSALGKGIKLTANYLAGQVFISERQFSRKLNTVAGLTPKEYILEVKLQKARHLLENKAFATIGEVAASCGFSSGSYLTKIFKEKFGKKPSDYIKT
jgi:signal transduction histidine kinase/DNA-binding response OmpR family regulator